MTTKQNPIHFQIKELFNFYAITILMGIDFM